MRYSINTLDQLILRDGKPFGDAKNFGGTGYDTILPQTLAGMVRTAIGFARDPNYFVSPENVQKILEVPVQRIMYAVPTLGQEHRFLAPPPADVFFTAAKGPITAHKLNFASLPEGQGTDIANPDWLVPTVDCAEKPAKNAPRRWFWDSFAKYLIGDFPDGSTYKQDALGIPSLINEVRIHNGLDPQSGRPRDGQLFANKQVYLAAKQGDGRSSIPVELSFETIDDLRWGRRSWAANARPWRFDSLRTLSRPCP